MIYHTINLIPTLNSIENVFINNWIYINDKIPFINWRKQKEAVRHMFENLNVDINLDIPVYKLGSAEQRIVEIIRAIYQKAKILILDETTSSLSDKETEDLFKVLTNVKSFGTSIFFISHKVKEIEEISDRVTILKRGKIVETKDKDDIDIEETIKNMTEESFNRYPKIKTKTNKKLLEVKNLSEDILLKDVSFYLKKGEILGITGQMGSGRSILAKTLTGVIKPNGGEIYVDNKPVSIKSSRDAIKNRIAYIPENYSDGLVYSMNMPNNISLSHLQSVLTNYVIDLKLERKLAEDYINRLGLKSKFLNQKVRYLSNGDKQKVMIAKWLLSRSNIFVLDEPTKGLDIPSKVEVYNIMNKIVLKGGGIILISSDFSELIGMCSRVLIMNKGQITKELSEGEINKRNIVFYSRL